MMDGASIPVLDLQLLVVYYSVIYNSSSPSYQGRTPQVVL